MRLKAFSNLGKSYFFNFSTKLIPENIVIKTMNIVISQMCGNVDVYGKLRV